MALSPDSEELGVLARRKASVFPHAAVASPHFLATGAGLAVLTRGGNAVDAAIATNLVLAVVCPHLCGAGGDLFAIVHKDGEIYGLNSSGRLPRRAALPSNGIVPQRGIGSATVPGAAAGWIALSDEFGSIPIEQLAEPAIRYAAEGFYPSPSLVRSLSLSRDLLESDAIAREIFLSRPKIQNPELAETLSDIRNFYTGPVAHNAPSPFTPEDFIEHRAEWVAPMRREWMGLEILEMPPNSRGHLVLEALDRMESLDGLRPDDAEFHFRMIRAIEGATTDGDTVYLCAHDESGMAVSINESNFMGFGSGVMVPGTGVHLHNRGAYMTPESYIGGVRPVHTLSPAMALENGIPRIVFGTMGGEAQIQIHMQLLARLVVAQQDPLDALAAPRWVKHGQGELLAEPGLPPIGAQTIPFSDIAGHAHLIVRTPEGLAAASDPRCDGLAAGY